MISFKSVLAFLAAAIVAMAIACDDETQPDAPTAAVEPPTAAAEVIPTASDGASESQAVEADADESATAIRIADLTDCVATPRQTEGPFYADVGGFRQDVTEGLHGEPLSVQFHVVEVGSCEPVPDVVVDIWHTDAEGRYSGFEQGARGVADTVGATYMRGKQITDANGFVEFQSVYPGWYPGRTVHIHFKVSNDDRTLVASQLFFPQEITDAVLERPPYDVNGAADTTNATDSVLRGDLTDHPLMGAVSSNGAGHTVALVVGIKP